MKRDGFAPSLQLYLNSLRFAYGGQPLKIWLYATGGSVVVWLLLYRELLVRWTGGVFVAWLIVSAAIYIWGIDRQAFTDAKTSLAVSENLSNVFDELYPRIKHPARDLKDPDLLWLARANDGLHQIQSTIVVTRVGLIFALVAAWITDPHGIPVFLLSLAFAAAEGFLQSYHEMLVRRRYRVLLLEWVEDHPLGHWNFRSTLTESKGWAG
jgi:hypothetical protein